MHDRLTRLLRDFGGVVQICVRQYHREFLSTVTRNEVCWASSNGAKRTRDSRQACIALEMSERIVVLLEMIDIDDDERKRRMRALRVINCLRILLVEIRPVVDSRQSIPDRRLQQEGRPGFVKFSPK